MSLQEYGTGRYNKKHSTFFAQMMKELGLRREVEWCVNHSLLLLSGCVHPCTVQLFNHFWRVLEYVRRQPHTGAHMILVLSHIGTLTWCRGKAWRP